MEYPLKVSFKIVTLASKFIITDRNGNFVFYVKQKMFKLKEAIKVFMDESQTDQLYSINADRILDFSGRYHFSDIGGQNLGSVKRKGGRSIWRAHYEINDPPTMTITEESVFVRFMDSMIPDICSGFLFHPSFLISRLDGTEMMRVKKKSSLFEGKFQIDKLAEMSDYEEAQILLSIMMMLLLERRRG